MEIEVKTLSKKQNEKRGHARLKMYRPNKQKNEVYSIQVTQSCGYSIVFVKTLAEMFIKPIIDSIIEEPSKNPLDPFTIITKEKTEEQEFATVKSKDKVNGVNCESCDKTFDDEKGLRIHTGRMHKENLESVKPSLKKNKRPLEQCEDDETRSDDCGQKFTVKERLRWHVENCQKRKKFSHDFKTFTPTSNKDMAPNEIHSEPKVKLSENLTPKIYTNATKGNHFDSKYLLCEKCDYSARGTYELKQHKRDAHRDITASVTPPPKKQRDSPKVVEEEVDIVTDKLTSLNMTEIGACEIPEDNRIPQRLENHLRIKGYNINEHMIQRVGGGGMCGVNCVSLHTTGSREQAKEIRLNINEHIVEHWDNIYKDSFNFPYTERVGIKSKTLKNEDEYIDFLLHNKEEASTLWMTPIDMQAASTMLNMNVSILTTGITSTNNHRCVRCKPGIEFSNEEYLRLHTKNVHNKVETEEEREGRIQRARWSELSPDNRIKDVIPNEKEEELILIHEDDIHYNLIVHKSHNAFKESSNIEHMKKKHSNNTSTIFGDSLQLNGIQETRSWAQVTEAYRPSLPNEQSKFSNTNCLKRKNTDTINTKEEMSSNIDDGWQQVAKIGGTKNRESPRPLSPKQKQPFNLPTQNRFINLQDTETSEYEVEMLCHKCELCGNEFQNQSAIEHHKRSEHRPNIKINAV